MAAETAKSQMTVNVMAAMAAPVSSPTAPGHASAVERYANAAAPAPVTVVDVLSRSFGSALRSMSCPMTAAMAAATTRTAGARRNTPSSTAASCHANATPWLPMRTVKRRSCAATINAPQAAAGTNGIGSASAATAYATIRTLAAVTAATSSASLTAAGDSLPCVPAMSAPRIPSQY